MVASRSSSGRVGEPPARHVAAEPAVGPPSPRRSPPGRSRRRSPCRCRTAAITCTAGSRSARSTHARQLGDQRRREPVAALGTVQRDARDAAGDLVGHRRRLAAHAGLLLRDGSGGDATGEPVTPEPRTMRPPATMSPSGGCSRRSAVWADASSVVRGRLAVCRRSLAVGRGCRAIRSSVAPRDCGLVAQRPHGLARVARGACLDRRACAHRRSAIARVRSLVARAGGAVARRCGDVALSHRLIASRHRCAPLCGRSPRDVSLSSASRSAWACARSVRDRSRAARVAGVAGRWLRSHTDTASSRSAACRSRSADARSAAGGEPICVGRGSVGVGLRLVEVRRGLIARGLPVCLLVALEHRPVACQCLDIVDVPLQVPLLARLHQLRVG